MSMQSIEPQISRLSRAEKAELLQRLAREVGNAWAGIEKTAGVSGGEACIVRTRIPVWTLENYRRLGWMESAILENFPSLRAVDLVNAWAYADAHVEEIDKAINPAIRTIKKLLIFMTGRNNCFFQKQNPSMFFKKKTDKRTKLV